MHRTLPFLSALLPAISACASHSGAPTAKDEAPAMSPAMAQRCADYRALLRSFRDGPPPALAGLALTIHKAEPIIAGAPAIDAADQALAINPVILERGDAAPTVRLEQPRAEKPDAPVDIDLSVPIAAPPPPPPPPPPGGVVSGKRPSKPLPIQLTEPLPPRLYVSTESGAPVSQIRALRQQLPATTELRLLVGRTDDELRALHLASFPRSPAAITAKVPARFDGDTAPLLIDAAGSCRPVVDAFLSVRDGATIAQVGPSMANAIAACECELGDLDGYVALVGALLLPTAELGALAIRAEVLEALPTDATVDDLAHALIAD